MEEKSVYEAIDKEIDNSDEQLIKLISRFVKIKSVRTKARPGAPFGRGAKRMLDAFRKEAKKRELLFKDYGVGFCSGALRDGEIDLGIWLHGDVVAAGSGWIYPPYRPTLLDGGFIVGRGATDNKGQLASIITLFDILKKTENLPKYNAAIFLGSAEETKMDDLYTPDGNGGFLSVAKPPRVSLVPDAGFPVAYGGKGGMNITFRSKKRIESFELTAGTQKEPGGAHALFSKIDENKIPSGVEVRKSRNGTVLSTFKPPRHGASPDPDGNMITLLLDALLPSGLIKEEEREFFEFLRAVSVDTKGEMLGIKTEHPEMKSLTVYLKDAFLRNKTLEFTVNIRFPVGITYEEIIERVAVIGERHGFSIEGRLGKAPYIIDKECDCVKLLCEAACEVIGKELAPFTTAGTTYAHLLPNAYPFGMSGNKIPEGFPEGHGGAHGPDEVVSLDRLKRAMKIYARAIIRFDNYFKNTP